MSGVIVPILQQRQFDFSYLAASATEAIPLHTALPVVPFKSGLIAVRIHTNNLQSGATFVLTLYPTLPSSTDGRQFYNTATTLGSVTVANSTAAPGYLQTSIATMNAAYVFVELKAVQAGSPGTLAAQLSADLVLREN